MKLTLKLTILFLAVIAIGLTTAPFLINWNSYKPAIEKQFSNKTGLKLEIGGNVNLHILPFPGVTISDIVVRNPEIETNQEILEIGRVELAVDYPSLFVGKVVFDQLSVIEPNINIASPQQGEFNWQTDEIKTLLAASSEKQNGLDQNNIDNTFVSGVAFKNISVQKAHLTVQQSGKDPLVLKDMKLDIKSASPLGPYNLSGKGTVQNQVIQFDAKTEKFVPDTQSLSLKADLFFPSYEARLSYSGVLGTRWPLDAQGESSLVFPVAGTFFDFDSKNNTRKNIKVKSLLTARPNDLTLKNLQITYGKNVLGKGRAGLTEQENKPYIFADIKLMNDPLLGELTDAIFVRNSHDDNKQSDPADNVRKYLDKSTDVPDKSGEYRAKLNVDMAELDGDLANIKDLTFKINKSSESVDINLNIGSIDVLDEGWGADNIVITSRTSYAPTEGASTITPDLVWSFESRGLDSFIKNRLGLTYPADFMSEHYSHATISGEADFNIQRFSLKHFEFQTKSKRLKASGEYIWPGEDGKPELMAEIRGENLAFHQKFFASGNESAPKDLKQTIESALSQWKNAASAFGVNLDVELTNISLAPENHVIDKFGLVAQLSESGLDVEDFYVSEAGQNEFKMSSDIDFSGEQSDLKFNINTNLAGAEKSLFGEYLTRIYSGTFPDQLKVLLEYSGTLDEGDVTANINFPKSAVNLSGTVADPLGKSSGGSFEVQLVSNDLFDVVSALPGDAYQGADLSGDTDFFVALQATENKLAASNIQGTLLDTAIKGDIEIKTTGTKPVVDAVIQLGSWDASRFTAPVNRKNENLKTIPGQKDNENTRNVRWSRNAFNAEWMHLLNGTLTFAASDIALDKFTLSEPSLEASLKDGRLDISAFETKVLGGQALLSGTVESKKDPRAPLTFSANVELKNIDSGQLTNTFDGLPDNFMSGDISHNGQYSSFGLSPAAMIFGLQGAGNIEGNSVTISGIDLDRLARNLSTANSGSDALALLNTSLSGGKTVFQTLKGQYTITEGIVNIEALDLQGQNTSVKGTGEIDLPLWKLDLQTVLTIEKPEDAPPIKANFKGPLDSPKKTFAQAPLRSFINNRLQNELQKILEDKLNLKGKAGEAAKPESETVKTPEREAETSSPASEKEMRSPPAKISPEEQILRGILGDMLQ